MSPSEPRSHTSVMRELVTLAGRRVLDIGSGDGSLVRRLRREGADAIGVEPGPQQLIRAREAADNDGALYVCAGAESLPLADATFDIAVFFNSLHHVPGDLHDRAMAEAMRVLRPGGTVYIAEPIAAGSYFELMRPVDDETEVRALAYETIGGAKKFGFSDGPEVTYATRYGHPDFDAMKSTVLAINPQRRPAFEANEADLRVQFERLADYDGSTYAFTQPMRVNLLEKR